MFCFKTNFNIEKCGDQVIIIKSQLSDLLSKQALFKNDELRYIDTLLEYKNEDIYDCEREWNDDLKDSLLFGFIIKNKNKNTCQLSHIEPKYEYQCPHCQNTPWFAHK